MPEENRAEFPGAGGDSRSALGTDITTGSVALARADLVQKGLRFGRRNLCRVGLNPLLRHEIFLADAKMGQRKKHPERGAAHASHILPRSEPGGIRLQPCAGERSSSCRRSYPKFPSAQSSISHCRSASPCRTSRFTYRTPRRAASRESDPSSGCGLSRCNTTL